jgi:N-acetylmuramoyl-L-alanine amidase
MLSSEHRRRLQSAVRAFPVAITLLLLLSSAPSAEEKQLSIYGPQISYSLPVSEHNGQDYVALLEALEPFGNVSAGADGENWKLRFNDLEAEFRQNATVGKVAGQKFGLPAPFVSEGNRGLVPLRALPGLLGLVLAIKTEYHEAAHRLFLGGAATRFTTDFGEGKLSVNFSAPVNPLISTEPGKLKMTFTRDPVIADTYLLRLENPLVSAITFSEGNGQAALVVQGRVPLLAQFAADRKTIDIVAAPAEAQGAPAAPGTTPAVAVPPPPTLQSLTAKPPFVVMLDASHGGDDRGALLSEKLEEKAVTLAFARRLRSELQNHGLSAVMSRDADVTVPVEQRAAMADGARVAVYLSLHATSQGRGVRVYTAMLNSASGQPGGFLPWDAAQSRYMLSSRALADIVKAELGKYEIPSSELPAPVQPLNHVAAAALAIEVAPSGTDVAGVTAAVYQQRIAAALAEAIVVGRSRVEAER